MGWSGGSAMANDVWELFEPLLTVRERPKYATKLADIFMFQDCDTLDECYWYCKYADQYEPPEEDENE